MPSNCSGLGGAVHFTSTLSIILCESRTRASSDVRQTYQPAPIRSLRAFVSAVDVLLVSVRAIRFACLSLSSGNMLRICSAMSLDRVPDSAWLKICRLIRLAMSFGTDLMISALRWICSCTAMPIGPCISFCNASKMMRPWLLCRAACRHVRPASVNRCVTIVEAVARAYSANPLVLA